MGLYFFDTSALVKRYALEAGTAWVQSITDPQTTNSIYIAEITGVEVIAAIKKRERMGVKSGGISKADAVSAIKDFRYDFTNQYKVVEIAGSIVSNAMDLTERHKLRAYDAVQLAIALEIASQIKTLTTSASPAAAIPALTIACSDNDLTNAAKAEGLSSEDPNNYP